MEKVYMTAYDANSMPSDEITTDGLHFKWNEPFFLICNKPIISKVYFEFSVDSYLPISAFHNIPLYIGISREASFGTLNADFCIGSIYYENGKNYDIQEKFNASSVNTHRSPATILTRIPGATDTIGVAVDVPNNVITIYNNGKAFYTFSPEAFNLSSETFYFCIYSDIYYDRVKYDSTSTTEDTTTSTINKSISGYINFGKVAVNYLPEGYTTIYGYYYKQQNYSMTFDVDGTVVTDPMKSISSFIDVDCTDINDTIVDRDIKLISTSPNVSIDGYKYTITADSTITDPVLYGANVFINLPIPTDRKIYIEMTATKGSVIDDIIGIPLSFGLADANTSILNSSHRLCLFHQKQAYYNYGIIKKMVQTLTPVGDIDTSIVPKEGNLIGVLFDLANSQYTIYIDKVAFFTAKSTDIDLSQRLPRRYFFIHDDSMFTGVLNGTVNIGTTAFDMTIPDDSISLYDYYNITYKELYAMSFDVDCTLMDDSKRDASIFVDCFLEDTSNYPDNFDSFGNLSILYNSYNTIEDEEAHITNDMSSPDLDQMIANDNNGYYPQESTDPAPIDYGTEDPSVQFNVSIIQSKNQTITVTYGKKKYTDGLVVPKNATIDISAVGSKGYDPGELRPGRKVMVTNDIAVYATDPTLHPYTVTVGQYDKQTIMVTCNDRVYTNTFNTTYGSKFTATIAASKGYDAGTLNMTDGTVTKDVSIYATPSLITTFPITIKQGKHYVIAVKYAGIEHTTDFTAVYGNPINVYIKSVDAGYVAPQIDNPIQVVTGPITIEYPDASEDTCTITIVGSYEGKALINDKLGTVFAFRKGDSVTIKVTPTDGYYIDAMTLTPQDTVF